MTAITEVKDGRGFTLIEVMIALLVLLSGVLGWIVFTWTTTKGTSFSREENTATFIAQSKLEELKQLGLAHSQLTDDASTTDLENTGTPDHINADPDTVNSTVANQPVNAHNETGKKDSIYYRMWNIAQNSPASGLKTVAVIVRWRSLLDGQTHQVILKTIYR
jgi:prepilin-type N-terminal cleavage/methylation domain-containing protein